MDEQKPSEQPPKYVWPRYVLAGVVLGIVLAVFWMAVLVRRVSQQRDSMAWPTNSLPAQSTNSTPATNSAAQESSVDPTKAQRMAEFHDTLAGGNVEAGRKVFFESPAASCGKCHKADGQGGDNGPVLNGILARQSRKFILESILFPNAVIDTNYQTVVVLLKDNRGLSGTLKSETETNLVLVTPEDGPVTVNKPEIQRRWIGVSPMPDGIWQQLTKQELRDLIEFVASLKSK
jgi:putative heme-binding domain-containing protein